MNVSLWLRVLHSSNSWAKLEENESEVSCSCWNSFKKESRLEVYGNKEYVLISLLKDTKEALLNLLN